MFVVGNDSDPDGDGFSVVGVDNPPNGTVLFDSSGIYYTPDVAFIGTETLTYTLRDNHGLTARATVTVTVTRAPNLPPIATSQNVSVTTGQTTAITLGASDPDGTPVTYAVGTPTGGTLTGTAPDLTYTAPATGGVYSFTFTAADGTFTSNTATVTITVTDPVNRPPVATNDTAAVDEDDSVSFDPRSQRHRRGQRPAGRRGHDTRRPRQRHLQRHVVHLHAGGQLQRPGLVHLHRCRTAGAGPPVGTVDLTVDPVNDAPVANIDTVTTTEGVATAVNVVANDADIDGDSLSVASNTQPAHGTATCGVTSCSYVPAPAFDGPDFFNYTVSDGNGGTATTTVNITVTSLNEAPAATLDVTPASATAPALVTATLGGTDPNGDAADLHPELGRRHPGAVGQPAGRRRPPTRTRGPGPTPSVWP